MARDALRQKFPQMRARLVVVRELQRWRDDQLHFRGREQAASGLCPFVAALDQVAMVGDRAACGYVDVAHTADSFAPRLAPIKSRRYQRMFARASPVRDQNRAVHSAISAAACAAASSWIADS